MKTNLGSLEVNRLRMSIEFCEQSDPPTPGSSLPSRHGRVISKAKVSKGNGRDGDILRVEAWLNQVIRKELAQALSQAERELKRRIMIDLPIDTAVVLGRALQIRRSPRLRRRR